MKTQPIGWRTTAIALVISMFWGANLIALKVSLTTFPPLWSAAWRMLCGVLAVGLWARSQSISMKPEPGEAGPLLVLGLMFTGQITMLNIGTDLTSAASAVVLLNSHPIFTNLTSHFFVPADRLSGGRIAGLAIALAGIAIVAFGRPEERFAPQPVLGNGILIACAFLLASRMVYMRHLVQKMEPVRAVWWEMALSLPIFFLLAGFLEKPLLQAVSWEPVLAILYQGTVVAGLCFIVWTYLLRKHSPGMLSMFGFAVPVFGIVLAALIFGEPISTRLLLGAIAVTVGILIVTRQQHVPEVSASSAAEEALQ
jgi:drug/metabolite transporter (DMT)-like permease